MNVCGSETAGKSGDLGALPIVRVYCQETNRPTFHIDHRQN